MEGGARRRGKRGNDEFIEEGVGKEGERTISSIGSCLSWFVGYYINWADCVHRLIISQRGEHLVCFILHNTHTHTHTHTHTNMQDEKKKKKRGRLI